MHFFFTYAFRASTGAWELLVKVVGEIGAPRYLWIKDVLRW